MARAIAQAGFDRVVHGANPIEIRRGVIAAVEAVNEQLLSKCEIIVLFPKSLLHGIMETQP